MRKNLVWYMLIVSLIILVLMIANLLNINYIKQENNNVEVLEKKVLILKDKQNKVSIPHLNLKGQGGVAHLLYAVAESGGICVRGEHVQTGKKNLTVFSVRKKPPEMSSMQELIVPESLFFQKVGVSGFFCLWVRCEQMQKLCRCH